jgi:signal transduction histidine kinase
VRCHDRLVEARGRLTVSVALAAFAAMAVGDVLGGLAPSGTASWGEMAIFHLALASAAGMGLLIGLRRGGHRVGLLLAAGGAVLGLMALAEGYGAYTVLAHPGSLPGGRIAVLLSDAAWPLLFAAVTAIAFVYPDGRLPSPRWRFVAGGAAAAFLGVTVLALFDPEPFEAPFEHVESPLPDSPTALEPLRALFVLGMLASLVAAALAIFIRYRRASALERTQILWLAFAAWLIPAAIVLCMVDAVLVGETGVITGVALGVALTAVPAAVGVAVLRYRLYEIDRVVNRTLVYGALTTCVLALYLVVALTIGWVAQSSGSLWASLAATAAVAVAVQPLRTLLQRRVDRLMYGDRNDPYAGLSRLAARLQATVEPREALRSIVDAVAEALRLPFVAIELARDNGFERAEHHGRPARGEQVKVPLAYGGDVVGRLVVEGRGLDEPLGAADRRLLHDLARHAGAAVHAVRLHDDLQRSRERLVLAREEERRRIRRDLHDGLGPTLASAVFQADAVRDLIRTSPDAADAQLADLRRALQQAVTDVRTLVYALRPPALDELGLVPALREQTARLELAGAGPRISVTAPDELPELPAAVEVAAFRIALEAVTNSVRHSGARTCRVSLSHNGALELEIHDDGCGKSGTNGGGVGIASMRERASELGGVLTIEPRPGVGTRVHAVLPLGRP